MNNKKRWFPGSTASFLATAVLVGVTFHVSRFTACAAVQVLGVQYQQDELFPEYNCIWHDRDYPTSCSGTYLGGNVHVYLKNTGPGSVTINDVTLAGYSLLTVLKLDANVHDANSIYFYWDNPPFDIIAAGEPVWYKGDPKTIFAGGVGQAVVRLRRPPTTATVTVGVVTSGGTVTTNIPIDTNAPQLANVGFSQDRSKVYLHWRRSGGAAPTTILMDGVDVTANTTTVGDPTMNFAESVLTPASPLNYMSYHVFQGVYADGKKATASLRAWSHEFLHASWSVFQVPDGDLTAGKAWLDDAINRGFNAVQNQIGGGVGDYLGTVSGRAYATSRGYGIISWNNNYSDPLMTFIKDEVDAEEANLESNFCGTGKKIPCGSSPMGILALRSIAVGEGFRNTYPNAPTTINMDGTYKPENYYAYGQAVDVLQADPYYQKRLKDTYWYHYPEWVSLYNKATYIYAVSKACTRAAEPNSFHVILNSTESKNSTTGEIWPFAPPQCKRIEVYYALAAGAKGISYWWFKPGYPSNGLGDQSRPNAPELWKEMGLYGNEIKTVSHLLVASHPVDLPLAPSVNVWARALAVGTDTMILLVVNDDYWNDQAFHSTDVPNATVTATMPSWMQSGLSAFEVTPGGVSDVSMQLNGDQLQVNLGTLKITRMIVVTKDAGLRATLQQRYDTEVRPGVCAFAPEYCANSAPTISQQPANQSITEGGTANFTVLASGSNPLSYRWQKDSANLNNGGHYSGATTPTLTITGADNNDVASYRCVVSNAYGSITSSVVSLTLATGCTPGSLVNADFEGGNTAGVANGWTAYEVNSPSIKVWSIQTALPPPGGSRYQQIQAYNDAHTASAGVRQNITGCIIGATYHLSGWYRSNSDFGRARVRVSLSSSTDWNTAIDLNPVADYGSTTNWATFSGTVVATGTNMTLWLDGRTISGTSAKVGCFDSVTITCTMAGGVPPTITQQPSARSIGIGGNVSFYIIAAGSTPLSYRWQKNSANLNNGGHYSGVTTSTLNISGADTNDAANYRCVVTNVYGSTNSTAVALTVTNTTIPPSFTQQPLDQSTFAGGSGSFFVQAEGSSPLSYQWQKNDVDVANGGHYSGATTPTFNITAADSNDFAAYRCVVTNAYGTNISAPATLSEIVISPCFGLANADFESGYDLAGGGYIATNWTEWEADPDVIIGYDEQGIIHRGEHSQRVRVWGGPGGSSGGVYQRVVATVGQPYLVGVWMYAGDNLTTCSLGVDPTGGTDPNSGVTWSSGTTNVGWVLQTLVGTANTDFITVYYRVSSPDDVKRNGYFDDSTPAAGSSPLQLMVERAGNTLTLTWPECPSAVLEQANSLTAPIVWNAVTNEVTAADGQKQVTLTPMDGAGFFRLVLE